LRSAEVRRTDRAWLTRELTGGRTGLDAAWVALVLLNLVAIAAWPSWDTVPFHLISTGFAVLYGLRLWPADPVLWGLGIVIITTFGGIGLDLLHNDQSVEEAAEIPLLAAMFVAIVWLANRRIGADRERQLIGEKNSRLLEAQRRFLQDASHHLRTPITIALTHAELLARDLDGRELRDIQTVLGEITRLRRLSERLLVIAAAEDPGFLRTEPVLLDEFAVELAHVFDRFRTGPNANGSRGTGLGLALVRAVADAHGGSARVRSAPGEGSEFQISLPAPRQP